MFILKDIVSMRIGFMIILIITFMCFNISCNKDTSKKKVQYDKPIINSDWYNVGFLITDGVYNTEFTAPFDIFQHTKFREGIKAMNVFSISNKSSYITSFEGVKIIPDYNFLQDQIPPIDILVVPSAEHHLDSDLENEALISWIKKVAKEAEFGGACSPSPARTRLVSDRLSAVRPAAGRLT